MLNNAVKWASAACLHYESSVELIIAPSRFSHSHFSTYCTFVRKQTMVELVDVSIGLENILQ